MKACRERIGHLFKLISENGNNSYLSLLDDKESVFRPENIFFMPDNKHAPTGFKKYWEKSFEMACDLLSPVYDAPVSRIKNDIKKLKHEIRREMLGQAFLRKSHPVNKDEAVLKILRKIENKWIASAGNNIEKTADEAEDMLETVIISREPLDNVHDMPEAVVISQEKKAFEPDEDDMPETVVISQGKNKFTDNPDIFDKAGDDDDFIMETVMLRSGSPDKKPGKDKKD